MNPPECLKCGTKMEVGYIPDKGYRRYFVPHWVPKPPRKSFFGLLKLPERRIPVRTCRCQQCGRLESFAIEALS